MHVVVVGCGRVGSELAASLTSSGHSVAVVDRRPEAFRRLPPTFRGQTVVGVGFDRKRLVEAGINHAEAVAAVTNGDNSNILVARVAKENFEVERVVARIYDPRRAAIYERLGIPTVATVEWTTHRVLSHLVPETAGIEWTAAGAEVHLVERVVPGALAGTRLADFEEAGRWRTAALTRLGRSEIPEAGVVLQEADVVHVTVSAGALADLDARLGTAGGDR